MYLAVTCVFASFPQVVSEMAVICVFASFPGSGCSEMAVTCVLVSFPDRWLLPVCLPPSLRDGCYLCFCLLPWVRLFGGGCYLCFCLLPWVRLFRDGCYLCACLLPWQVAVTCVFASFAERWLLPVFLPPSLTEAAVTSCLLPSVNQVIQTPRWLLPVFLPPSLRLSQVVQRWLLPVFCCGCLCVSDTPCARPQRLLAHCWLPSSPSSPSSARTTSQYCFTCLCFGLWTDYCRHERCFGCDSKCVDAVFTLNLFCCCWWWWWWWWYKAMLMSTSIPFHNSFSIPWPILIIWRPWMSLNKLKSVSLPGLIVPFETPPQKKKPQNPEWINHMWLFLFFIFMM